MDDTKQQFIDEVFLSNAISSGFGRGKANYSGNPTEEERAMLGREIRNKLRELGAKYPTDGNVTLADDQHTDNIVALADAVSSRCGSFLEGGRLRVGRAQKLLNLYLKLLWCNKLIAAPPHCPFDGIILGKLWRKLKPETQKIPWTGADDRTIYEEWVAAGKKVAEDVSLSLAGWELKVWSDEQAKL